MTQEALKLALEALEESGIIWKTEKAITAIKEALREHAMREVQRLGQEIEQEPVACIYKNYLFMAHEFQSGQVPVDSQPLYTHPPQRTWVGLEGEEIRNLWEEATKPDRSTMTMVTSFAKSIEAKLKQLNT